VNRRKFLAAAAGTATVAGLATGFLRSHGPRSSAPVARGLPPLPPDPAFPNALLLPGADGLLGIIDAGGSLAIVAKPIVHALLPGKPTRMLAFETDTQGRLFHNPVLRVRTGTRMRVSFLNALEEPSIIHWHGLKVDSNNDGHPHYAVPGGAVYDYQFTVPNRAAMYWYHPHPHHRTGAQVYLGLAGCFLVEDDEELALQRALDLALGATDVPLVIQDRRFDPDGRLVFADGASERFLGRYGTEVLVNFTPRPYFDVTSRVYRFRILNGSNARLYRLAFRHGDALVDFTLIGTDGGLLDRPRAIREAFLAPGERIDVLLDLRAASRGDAVTLTSLAFDPMHPERPHAGGGQDAHDALPDGAEIELMRIRVEQKTLYDRAVPHALSRIEPAAASPYSPRLIVLDQAQGRWRINGLTYDVAATPIAVKRDSVEAWDFRNVRPTMPHPMHIHGFQFRVVSRTGSPEQQRRLAVDSSGLAATDLGWKDTVLVWPGETVRIVTDFSHPFLGDQVYMIHCHNLDHEDGGMMLNLRVAA